MGKNWACSRLAQQAGGELFFFTDADTFHRPQTLRAMVTALMGEQADLLTGFPRQEMHTWGERLLVPFFSWAFYCFYPLALAYRMRMPALTVAVGQRMLFRERGLRGHRRAQQCANIYSGRHHAGKAVENVRDALAGDLCGGFDLLPDVSWKY